ncbi:MAG: dephospho-CoA kinase [Flavobacteriaceae bacterium]|nr:dephospho-CoA kinase [Flavobacteriaceae bacterium]
MKSQHNSAKVVGLTGGIGSGKTTVAQYFIELGIPVYIADERAKYLMQYNLDIRKSIVDLLGVEAYENERLNRAYIASRVFADKNLLHQLNAIVHPAVAVDFYKWLSEQNTPYVVKESALLVETGDYKTCDWVILVTAPIEERIKRVMKRDNVSAEAVKSRIANQLPDEDKQKYADYIIETQSKFTTKNIINNINLKILNKI